MLQRIFDETQPGVDVDILRAVLVDCHILAAPRDDAEGRLGRQQLFHVALRGGGTPKLRPGGPAARRPGPVKCESSFLTEALFARPFETEPT